MREKIMTKLHDLEKKHEIRILLAVNYGSRCFGYASPESDWDVRFIYVHRPEWYFSINKTEDTIQMEDGEQDLSGYDLKKALSLLEKTNPNESDWLHATDYYILDADFLKAMRAFESQCYNVHHAMHHFYSIGLKHNERYLQKEVTLKRFVYYMRGILSCRWLEKWGTHPPVIVDELVDATMTDNDEVRESTHRLLELKRMGKKNDALIVDDKLYEYVYALQVYYKEFLQNYASEKPRADYAAMSRFLMETSMSMEAFNDE